MLEDHSQTPLSTKKAFRRLSYALQQDNFDNEYLFDSEFSMMNNNVDLSESECDTQSEMKTCYSSFDFNMDQEQNNKKEKFNDAFKKDWMKVHYSKPVFAIRKVRQEEKKELDLKREVTFGQTATFFSKPNITPSPGSYK